MIKVDNLVKGFSVSCSMTNKNIPMQNSLKPDLGATGRFSRLKVIFRQFS